MLPVAYRLIKGFATFFGVLGILACIAGVIGGIIVNGNEIKKGQTPATQAVQASQLLF